MRNFLKFMSALSLVLIFHISSSLAQTDAKKNINYKENTLLWKVSGKNLKQNSYLFGTYHFAGKSFLDSLKGVKEAFASCAAVVGELDLSDMSQLRKKLMPAMMSSMPLDKILNETDYSTVNNFSKEIAKMDLSALKMLKPAAINFTLISYLAPKTITKENPGIDEYFQSWGKQLNKKIIGLETIDDQINTMFGESVDKQAKKLVKSAQKGVDSTKANAEELYLNYKAQDLKKLEAMFTDSQDYTEDEMDRLLKNRNLNWLKLLPEIMKEQSAFIAVGAGHLLGEWGLIAQLKKAGYKVTPVKTK